MGYCDIESSERIGDRFWEFCWDRKALAVVVVHVREPAVQAIEVTLVQPGGPCIAAHHLWPGSVGITHCDNAITEDTEEVELWFGQWLGTDEHNGIEEPFGMGSVVWVTGLHGVEGVIGESVPS